MSSILFTVCARGGSKGLPSKNIKPLLGKPLIHYTLEIAKASGLTPHIVVSSDSDEILSIAAQVTGISTLKRPAELANDTISKLPAIRLAVEETEKKLNKKFDFIIDLDPTSPLREVDDVKNSFDYFRNSTFDNLITACEARRSPYFNLVETTADGRVALSKRPEKPVTSRQGSPACYDMNASIYIWKRDALFELERVVDQNTGLYIMTAERSVDIDHPIDFDLVELLMKRKVNEGKAL